jgi:UDP-glucose 4-epimerase
MEILVSGGGDYIGSRIALSLRQTGFDIDVPDNLSSGLGQSVPRVTRIVERPAIFLRGDIGVSALLERLFAERSVGAILHFGGSKRRSAKAFPCPISTTTTTSMAGKFFRKPC